MEYYKYVETGNAVDQRAVGSQIRHKLLYMQYCYPVLIKSFYNIPIIFN